MFIKFIFSTDISIKCSFTEYETLNVYILTNISTVFQHCKAVDQRVEIEK